MHTTTNDLLTNDVVIVGASLVGASAAIALHQLGLKVTIIDAKSAEINLAPLDSRVYALSNSNIAWLTSLNVWQRYDKSRTNPIEKMQIWSDGGRELVLDAFDANTLSLGVIVENNHLLTAMYQELDALGIERLIGKVTVVDYSAEAAVLQGDFDVELSQITAKLVLAADGAQSWIRQNAGIDVTTHDYQHQGVVANFSVTKPHCNIARQWFKGESILAFLPMPNDVVSIVWATDNQHATQLLALNALELADEVSSACAYTSGDLQLVTPAKAFPIHAQQADSLVAQRLVLIGDAAHTIHPLAGQGVNLGFRDVQALVGSWRAAPKHIDTGRTLQHYARSRQLDMLLMRSLTHGLQKLFASDSAMAKKVRNQGMDWLQQQNQLKKMLMRQM